MSPLMNLDPYGAIDDTNLTMKRLLPGPIERVWRYLTESDLRRKWLASGEMLLEEGSEFTLTWRNNELTDPPGKTPEGKSGEHTMACTMLAVDAPYHLKFTWGSTGGVSFDLEEQGDQVLLVLTHHRVTDPEMLLGVSAGWHAHLQLMGSLLTKNLPEPHWDAYNRLRIEYSERLGIPG